MQTSTPTDATRTSSGAVDTGTRHHREQAILTTRNGSQAPIKDLLKNIYDYFTKPAIDGFQNGKRTDDPNKACRNFGGHPDLRQFQRLPERYLQLH